jgi:hypothetical protein
MLSAQSNFVKHDNEIPHGTTFDDGRRWCVICKTPKLTCIATTDQDSLQHWGCTRCQTVWPEYEHEFAQMLYDYLEDGEYILQSIH